jgi:hypothetical protein
VDGTVLQRFTGNFGRHVCTVNMLVRLKVTYQYYMSWKEVPVVDGITAGESQMIYIATKKRCWTYQTNILQSNASSYRST